MKGGGLTSFLQSHFSIPVQLSVSLPATQILGAVLRWGKKVANNIMECLLFRLKFMQNCSPFHRKRTSGLLPEHFKAKIRGWTLERNSHLEIHERLQERNDHLIHGRTTNLPALRSQGKLVRWNDARALQLGAKEQIISSWCFRRDLGTQSRLMLAQDHVSEDIASVAEP